MSFILAIAGVASGIGYAAWGAYEDVREKTVASLVTALALGLGALVLLVWLWGRVVVALGGKRKGSAAYRAVGAIERIALAAVGLLVGLVQSVLAPFVKLIGVIL